MQRFGCSALLLLVALYGCNRDFTPLPSPDQNCADRIQNGTETGIDCGGSCPACAAGISCAVDGDCLSGVCTSLVCQSPVCNDVVQNGDETAVDCGGSCSTGCNAGDTCSVDRDCADDACDSVSGTCLRVLEGNIIVRDATGFDVLNNVDLVRGSLDIRTRGTTTVPALPLTVVEGDLVISGNTELVDLAGLGNLREVTGDLTIQSNGELAQLGATTPQPPTGLGSLTTVSGRLVIKENDTLASLEGLGSLTHTGGLEIINMESMESLVGLEALEEVEGDFIISENDGIVDIDPLLNLKVVFGNFVLSDNESLLDVSGLSALVEITGDAECTFNSDLQTFSGWDALTFVGGRLRVRSNDALATLGGLGALFDVGDSLDISDNPELTTITAFANLAFIGNGFYVYGNNALDTLGGFASLEAVGGLFMVGRASLFFGSEIVVWGAANVDLTTLTGFGSLRSAGSLIISENPSLTTFTSFAENLVILDGRTSLRLDSGLFGGLQVDTGKLTDDGGRLLLADIPITALPSVLEGLDTIEGEIRLENLDITSLNPLAPVDFEESLVLTNLPRLTQVDSFAGVTSLAGLSISNLPLLDDLSAFSSLEEVDGELLLVELPSLPDLTDFASLATVTGSLALSGVLNFVDLAEFGGLEAVGSLDLFENFRLLTVNAGAVDIPGRLQVEDNPLVSSVTGPNATTAMQTVRVSGSSALLTVAGFSALETVTKIVSIKGDNITTLPSFPALSSVGTALTADAPSAPSIAFPALESVAKGIPITSSGGITITGGPATTSVQLPLLDEAKSVNFNLNSALVDLSSLRRVQTMLTITGAQDSINLPSLERAGSLAVTMSDNVTSVLAPLLSVLTGPLQIQNNANVVDLNFASLLAASSVSISNNPSLHECQGTRVCIQVNATGSRCDTTGLDITPCGPTPMECTGATPNCDADDMAPNCYVCTP